MKNIKVDKVILYYMDRVDPVSYRKMGLQPLL